MPSDWKSLRRQAGECPSRLAVVKNPSAFSRQSFDFECSFRRPERFVLLHSIHPSFR